MVSIQNCKKIFLCLSLIILVHCTYSQVSKEDIDIGKQLMERNDFETAIRYFSTIIKKEKGAHEAYFYRAQCYAKLNNTEAALKDYEMTKQLNPESSNAYIRIGNIYYNQKNYLKALEEYTIGLKYANRKAPIYSGIGTTLASLKRYPEAYQSFTEAIQNEPSVAIYYYERGNISRSMLQFKQAIEDYNESIRLDPKHAPSYNTRGICHIFLGEYKYAVDDYDSSVKVEENPDNTTAFLNSFEPLARQYKFKEVTERYKFYLTIKKKGYLDSEDRKYFRKYIEAITKLTEPNGIKEALELLNEAEILYNSMDDNDISSPTRRRIYSAILSLKGYLFEKENNFEKAKSLYKQSLLLNAKQPEVEAGLARISDIAAAATKIDKTAPTIQILEPLAENRSISIGEDKIAGAKQLLRGIASDPSGIRTLLINNINVRVENNGYFETELPLKAGETKFIITATDNNSNSSNQTVSIIARGVVLTNQNKNRASTESELLNEDPVYHAILIQESEYNDKNIPSLSGPVRDMAKVYSILVEKYSFLPENIIKLNSPGKTQILETIIQKSSALKSNDNLLIFYAGHGLMEKNPNNKEEGFLLPADAIKGAKSTYIRGDDLVHSFEFSKANHILLIADACFAGTLFRSINNEAPASVVEAYKDQSRKIMASGNRTVVPDESPFIAQLQTAFLNNRKKYITAEQLLNIFKEEYTDKTHLNLQYYPIAGLDMGGHFVFKRKQ